MTPHSLKGLAEAATPGEWTRREVHGEIFVSAKPYKGHPYFERTTTIEIMSDEDYPTKPQDAAFIAAANPAAILALLSEMEGLRRDARRWQLCLSQGFPRKCFHPPTGEAYWYVPGLTDDLAHKTAVQAIDAANDALAAQSTGERK